MFVVEINILSCRPEFAVGAQGYLNPSLPYLIRSPHNEQQYHDFRFALLLRASSSFSSSSIRVQV